MVAHGGTSVAGSFIQTLTMVDVATGWTECLPLVTRDGSLVVEAMKHARSLFPWLLRGVEFDNDSAFMNDVVVPWCREQKLEVTRSRAYKKNDQAFVEQKNGAVVRRLMGYGRFDGVETARVMARLYAAARLYVNFFQPSFNLKEKRPEGAKVIKRYHVPSTPCQRALVYPRLAAAVKKRLREQYRTLDPVALLAEIRAAQEELGNRADGRAGDARGQQRAGKETTPQPVQSSTPDAVAFAKTLGTTVGAGDPRATHRRPKRPYKTTARMPSKLGAHVVTIEYWLAAEPQLTALAILGRLIEKHPEQFGMKQHSIVQRLLKALRKKVAETLISEAASHYDDRCPIDRACGRLGLSRARPAHSPCRRASLNSREAQPISRHGIVSTDCALRVTFADEAIRRIDFECMMRPAAVPGVALKWHIAFGEDDVVMPCSQKHHAGRGRRLHER